MVVERGRGLSLEQSQRPRSLACRRHGSAPVPAQIDIHRDCSRLPRGCSSLCVERTGIFSKNDGGVPHTLVDRLISPRQRIGSPFVALPWPGRIREHGMLPITDSRQSSPLQGRNGCNHSLNKDLNNTLVNCTSRKEAPYVAQRQCNPDSLKTAFVVAHCFQSVGGLIMVAIVLSSMHYSHVFLHPRVEVFPFVASQRLRLTAGELAVVHFS